jgi:hypothetical protein
MKHCLLYKVSQTTFINLEDYTGKRYYPSQLPITQMGNILTGPNNPTVTQALRFCFLPWNWREQKMWVITRNCYIGNATYGLSQISDVKEAEIPG